MGIIDKWKAIYFPLPHSCAPDGLPEAVSLEDTSSIFTLFIFTIMADTAVLVLEFLWFKSKPTILDTYRHFKVHLYDLDTSKQFKLFPVFYNPPNMQIRG